MKRETKDRQRGIALFFTVFALLLLTGIGAAMILAANTETSVNSNYRNEQIAYFGAKAGIEEARARMMPSDPNTINSVGTPLPVSAPTASNAGIIYIVNNGSASNAVQPWNPSNAYADDELCHDGYGFAGDIAAPDVRCNTSQLPPPGWYTSYSSTIPFSGTSAPLPYKWVRVAPKLNGTVDYLTGNGSSASISYYSVNGAGSASTPICWDGEEEVLLTTSSCKAMHNSSVTSMSTVYVVTALGVSPTGARKMLSAEISLTPSNPFPYGLFATGTGCGALTMSGNAHTDGYSSAGGGYNATKNLTEGGVGSFGNITMTGGALVGGPIGVEVPTAGNCPADLTTSGNAGVVPGQTPPNSEQALTVPLPTFPTPPAPNPLPPTTNKNYSSSASIVPGSYGNINVSGSATLTLAPGTYNINSLSVSGNGVIIVNPPTGQVVLNMAGTGANSVLTLSGNSVDNPSLIASNFQINYAGTGSIQLSGSANSYMVVNAPNAAITVSGNGDLYGSILGSTINYSGNGTFHYDINSAAAPPSNGYFTMIDYHAVPY